MCLLRTMTLVLCLSLWPGCESTGVRGGLAEGPPRAPPNAAPASTRAKIRVEPSDLDFGALPPQQSRSLRVTVSNDGDHALDVTGLFVDAPPDAGFSITESPFRLAPGASRPIDVRYRAAPCAPSAGHLIFESNAADTPAVAVALAGRPTMAQVAFAPASLDFGDVLLGASLERTLTLRNRGDAPLIVSDVTLTPATPRSFALTRPTLPLTLAARAELRVALRYTPRGAGLERGALASSFCKDRVVEVPLRATGTVVPAATLEVTPRALDFGDVMQGRTRDQSVRLRATGQLPVTVSEIAHTGGTAEFTALTSAGFTLAPGDSANIRFRYAPTDVGADTGDFVIVSNASNVPRATIALRGNGTPIVACVLSATPMLLSFRAPVGGSTTRDTHLTNIGNGPCTVSGIRVDLQPPTARFEIVSGTSPQTPIAPGASVPVRVRYGPNAEGNHNSTLSLSSPDVVSPPRVRLLGAARRARVEVLPPELDFGAVTLTCAAPTAAVTVWNLGTDDLVFHRAEIAGGASSPFRIVSAPSAGSVIRGGESANVVIGYTPRATASDHDVLRISTSDETRDPVLVPLRGLGTEDELVTDTFSQPTNAKVDFLFVIDDSESMSQEQANLRRNLAALVANADVRGGDYQLGVVTTDLFDPQKGGRLQGTPRIVRSSDTSPASAFSTNANVGTRGNNAEQGLDAMRLALTAPNLTPGGANEGLVRSGASLEVIVLSDEEDQSPGTPAFHVAMLRSIAAVGKLSHARLSSIVGPEPSGCRSASGIADPGTRYLEVSRLTGGVIGSICDEDFARTLAEVVERAFALRQRFHLSRTPVPSTLRVTVDAQVMTERAQWSHDAASNEVVFTAASIPSAGSSIVVTYRAACSRP